MKKTYFLDKNFLQVEKTDIPEIKTEIPDSPESPDPPVYMKLSPMSMEPEPMETDEPVKKQLPL